VFECGLETSALRQPSAEYGFVPEEKYIQGVPGGMCETSGECSYILYIYDCEEI